MYSDFTASVHVCCGIELWLSPLTLVFILYASYESIVEPQLLWTWLESNPAEWLNPCMLIWINPFLPSGHLLGHSATLLSMFPECHTISSYPGPKFLPQCFSLVHKSLDPLSHRKLAGPSETITICSSCLSVNMAVTLALSTVSLVTSSTLTLHLWSAIFPSSFSLSWQSSLLSSMSITAIFSLCPSQTPLLQPFYSSSSLASSLLFHPTVTHALPMFWGGRMWLLTPSSRSYWWPKTHLSLFLEVSNIMPTFRKSYCMLCCLDHFQTYSKTYYCLADGLYIQWIHICIWYICNWLGSTG